MWVLLDHSFNQQIQTRESRCDGTDRTIARPLRDLAREHLVQDEAQRIDISAMIHLFTTSALLRSGVYEVRQLVRLPRLDRGQQLLFFEMRDPEICEQHTIFSGLM